MNQNDDIALEHEISALRTANLWAKVALMLLGLIGMGALVWVIDHYFGAPGVRVFLVAAGVIGLVMLIYIMSIGVSAVFGRQAMAHHDAVLQGLIAFQRADDYGEVARSVATGMSGAIRSGNQIDARVLQIANQIARQQSAQLADSQRQQQAQLPPGWAMIDDDQADVGQFRHID